LTKIETNISGNYLLAVTGAIGAGGWLAGSAYQLSYKALQKTLVRGGKLVDFARSWRSISTSTRV
jgi:hypothetical protein